jgi:hypothetical protein
MTTFILILMALLLVLALERNNRRQPPRPPGLNGLHDHDDRDWARTQHDLVALGDQPIWSATQQLGPRIF